MSEGFFPSASLYYDERPTVLAPQCGKCGLLHKCRHGMMPVSGQGRKKVLMVGEAPGEEEDRQGEQFIGDAGHKLSYCLMKATGLDLKRDCWVTNALACRPMDKLGRNREPTRKEIGYCRPLVQKAIRDLNPEVVLLLGSAAVQSVLGWTWKADPGGVTRWAGYVIPSREPHCWICPTWHPAACLYDDTDLTEKLLVKHLEAAAAKIGSRPWPNGAPDERKEVRVLGVESAAWTLSALDFGAPIAFDFETQSLKPDRSDTNILCCGVSNGRTTLAFPWQGSAVDAMKGLLANATPKIGWNMNFEKRWTLRKLGIDVNNFMFDGMLGSHAQDGRPGITGLKFQAYVRFGAESYDDALKPYLESEDESEEGGNALNRAVQEIDPHQLMEYCGIDTLLEWKIGVQLAQELGVQL